MRKSQSVRHHARPSMASGIVDDLGVLRETEETVEDTCHSLRLKLLEKERECDRLQMSIENYKIQLEQRPPLEAYQKLQREHKDLELLLQGTLRENEKCMGDLERSKAREKLLERELTRLAGDNWQINLEIPPPPSLPLRSSSAVAGGLNLMHQRSNTISSPISHTHMIGRSHTHSPTPSLLQDGPGLPSGTRSPQPWHQDGLSDPSTKGEIDAKRRAQIEEVRMLILGLDQKLDAHQGRLMDMMEKAETEGRTYEIRVAQAQKAGVSIS